MQTNFIFLFSFLVIFPFLSNASWFRGLFGKNKERIERRKHPKPPSTLTDPFDDAGRLSNSRDHLNDYERSDDEYDDRYNYHDDPPRRNHEYDNYQYDSNHHNHHHHSSNNSFQRGEINSRQYSQERTQRTTTRTRSLKPTLTTFSTLTITLFDNPSSITLPIQASFTDSHREDQNDNETNQAEASHGIRSPFTIMAAITSTKKTTTTTTTTGFPVITFTTHLTRTFPIRTPSSVVTGLPRPSSTGKTTTTTTTTRSSTTTTRTTTSTTSTTTTSSTTTSTTTTSTTTTSMTTSTTTSTTTTSTTTTKKTFTVRPPTTVITGLPMPSSTTTSTTTSTNHSDTSTTPLPQITDDNDVFDNIGKWIIPSDCVIPDLDDCVCPLGFHCSLDYANSPTLEKDEMIMDALNPSANYHNHAQNNHCPSLVCHPDCIDCSNHKVQCRCDVDELCIVVPERCTRCSMAICIKTCDVKKNSKKYLEMEKCKYCDKEKETCQVKNEEEGLGICKPRVFLASSKFHI